MLLQLRLATVLHWRMQLAQQRRGCCFSVNLSAHRMAAVVVLFGNKVKLSVCCEYIYSTLPAFPLCTSSLRMEILDQWNWRWWLCVSVWVCVCRRICITGIVVHSTLTQESMHQNGLRWANRMTVMEKYRLKKSTKMRVSINKQYCRSHWWWKRITSSSLSTRYLLFWLVVKV